MSPLFRSLLPVRSPAAALALLLALTACTGSKEQPGPESSAPAPEVRLQSAPSQPQVINAAPPEAAIAASTAFFKESAIAVLADPAAKDALPSAAAEAEKRGVPLLMAGSEQLPAELDRLGVEAVLAYGTDATDWSAVVGERTVVRGTSTPAPGEGTAAAPAATPDSDAGDAGQDGLPEVRRAAEPANAMVVYTGAEDGQLPVLANARAAGAQVQPLETADPRASAASVQLFQAAAGRNLIAAGPGFGSAADFTALSAVAQTGLQLPGGGQTVFPGRRMVALYGHPGTPSMGLLGEQGIEASIQRVKKLAADYQPFSAEPVVPAFEIITTVASSAPGADGNYTSYSTLEHIRPWVDAAEQAGVYVVLDLQPGRVDFLTQAKRYEELLKRPHVGLALDPEWRLKPNQRHLVQIGTVDAAEINQVSDWLADLTRANNLPQKAYVLHQFRLSMITNRPLLDVSHPELAMILHADGHGGPGQKLETWNALRKGLQPEIRLAWKNFIDEDRPTFTPQQTMQSVEPAPWFVSYQ